MIEKSTVGLTLRRHRLAAGYSLANFARLARYDKGYISKIENGKRRPSVEFCRRVDLLLETDGVLEALVPAEPSAAGPMSPVREQAPVRRDAGPARSTHAALAAAAGGACTHLRAMCRQVDAATAGRLVEPAAEVLSAAAAGCPDQRCELLETAIAYADLAGWMAQERDDPRALEWIEVTERLAERLGAVDALAHAWVRRAEVALHRGDPASALDSARIATDFPPDRVRPANAHVTALARARQGDAEGCAQAIARMAPADAAAVGGFRLGSTSLDDLRRATVGWCAVDLDCDDDGIACLEATVRALPPTSTRMYGLYSGRLSGAYARVGDRRQAVRAGRGAVACVRRTGSAATLTQLRNAAHELTRWRRDTAVQQFRSEVAALG